MQRIFLASSFKDAAPAFAKREPDLAGKTVTFIPTASAVERVVFYVSAGKKALAQMGLIVDELELSTASPDEISAKLKGNHLIYLTGGNTFYLLQELKRTGADRLIAQEVAAGKLYIGESAGAMVASKNVEYAKCMDSVKKAPGLADYGALGLVDFYPVPHYESAPFKKAARKMVDTYASTLDVVPIRNREAIWVRDGEMSVERG